MGVVQIPSGKALMGSDGHYPKAAIVLGMPCRGPTLLEGLAAFKSEPRAYWSSRNCDRLISD